MIDLINNYLMALWLYLYSLFSLLFFIFLLLIFLPHYLSLGLGEYIKSHIEDNRIHQNHYRNYFKELIGFHQACKFMSLFVIITYKMGFVLTGVSYGICWTVFYGTIFFSLYVHYFIILRLNTRQNQKYVRLVGYTFGHLKVILLGASGSFVGEKILARENPAITPGYLENTINFSVGIPGARTIEGKQMRFFIEERFNGNVPDWKDYVDEYGYIDVKKAKLRIAYEDQYNALKEKITVAILQDNDGLAEALTKEKDNLKDFSKISETDLKLAIVREAEEAKRASLKSSVNDSTNSNKEFSSTEGTASSNKKVDTSKIFRKNNQLDLYGLQDKKLHATGVEKEEIKEK